MSIEKFYNKSVEVYRLADDDSGYGEVYALHLAEVNCGIQTLDDRFNEDIEGSFGKDFLMMCGVVDIKEGDRVIDGEVEYRVVGVEVYDMGNNPHIELIIRTFNK